MSRAIGKQALGVSTLLIGNTGRPDFQSKMSTSLLAEWKADAKREKESGSEEYRIKSSVFF